MQLEEPQTVQIIGGGFSGLALAYFSVKAGKRVRLVEASDRCGGILRTVETEYGLVETAANALLSNKLVEVVAKDLGLSLVATLPAAKKRFIFRRGRPRRWPLSGVATMRLLADTAPKFFTRRSALAPRPRETIAGWGMRCIGREATEYLLVPALSGIYAGRSEDLSASLILSRFFRKNHVPRGKLKGSVAPLPGMGEWGKAFTEFLRRHDVEFATSALEGMPTIVALPPPRAREFLHGKAPKLEAALAKVEMLPLVSVTCFFPAASPGLEGFGCLFPRTEGFRVLGLLANDCIFPGRVKKARSETWIFGGATDRKILELSDEEIIQLIAKEREKIFGIETVMLHHVISRWPEAVPHYNLGLEQMLSDTPLTENNYTLFGTYLGDLGLARVLAKAAELA